MQLDSLSLSYQRYVSPLSLPPSLCRKVTVLRHADAPVLHYSRLCPVLSYPFNSFPCLSFLLSYHILSVGLRRHRSPSPGLHTPQVVWNANANAVCYVFRVGRSPLCFESEFAILFGHHVPRISFLPWTSSKSLTRSFALVR